jgi:hypothetical protein
MSIPTADERAALAARDDGDPADMVYLVARGSSTHYHDNRGCHYLRRATRPVAERPRRSVKSRTRRAPCSACVLGD